MNITINTYISLINYDNYPFNVLKYALQSWYMAYHSSIYKRHSIWVEHKNINHEKTNKLVMFYVIESRVYSLLFCTFFTFLWRLMCRTICYGYVYVHSCNTPITQSFVDVKVQFVKDTNHKATLFGTEIAT